MRAHAFFLGLGFLFVLVLCVYGGFQIVLAVRHLVRG